MQTVDFELLRLREGDSVLDLGCGEGRHVISAYVLEDVRSVGVDLCVTDLATTREKFLEFNEPDNAAKSFSLAAANALCLPFADSSFDKVICSEVLEHIPDYRGVLKEINRVLKPGGVLAVSVPRWLPEWICWALRDEYHTNDGGHIRVFWAPTLRRDVEAGGLQFFARHWAHALHTPFWWLKCLFWYSRDTNPVIKLYHRLLVWDIIDKPWITQTVEKLLNPLLGKSVVMYFEKCANPTPVCEPVA